MDAIPTHIQRLDAAGALLGLTETAPTICPSVAAAAFASSPNRSLSAGSPRDLHGALPAEDAPRADLSPRAPSTSPPKASPSSRRRKRTQPQGLTWCQSTTIDEGNNLVTLPSPQAAPSAAGARPVKWARNAPRPAGSHDSPPPQSPHVPHPVVGTSSPSGSPLVPSASLSPSTSAATTSGGSTSGAAPAGAMPPPPAPPAVPKGRRRALPAAAAASTATTAAGGAAGPSTAVVMGEHTIDLR